jgi:Cadherin domain
MSKLFTFLMASLEVNFKNLSLNSFRKLIDFIQATLEKVYDNLRFIYLSGKCYLNKSFLIKGPYVKQFSLSNDNLLREKLAFPRIINRGDSVKDTSKVDDSSRLFKNSMANSFMPIFNFQYFLVFMVALFLSFGKTKAQSGTISWPAACATANCTSPYTDVNGVTLTYSAVYGTGSGPTANIYNTAPFQNRGVTIGTAADGFQTSSTAVTGTQGLQLLHDYTAADPDATVGNMYKFTYSKALQGVSFPIYDLTSYAVSCRQVLAGSAVYTDRVEVTGLDINGNVVFPTITELARGTYNNGSYDPTDNPSYIINDQYVIAGNTAYVTGGHISTTGSTTQVTDAGFNMASMDIMVSFSVPVTEIRIVYKNHSGGNLGLRKTTTTATCPVLLTSISANEDLAVQGIVVGNVSYTGICNAGINAPIITATTVNNTCPTTTFSLAALPNTGTQPAGTSLIWSTHKVPTSASDTLTNLTTVSTAGTYYALYYDKVNNCYSPADSVDASLSNCAPATIPGLACNTKSPFVNGSVFNNLTATGSTAGICVPLVSGVSNPSNAVDASLTNFAQINLNGIGCSGSLKIVDSDAADTYPIGTFAGFKISSANLISGSIASTITIRTYNNGSVVETYNAVTSLLGLNASLLNGDGTATIGFITTQPFDGIEITYGSLLGVLNSFQVYHPVIETFCAGPALVCNVQTGLNNPSFPTIIDLDQTDITGLCVGCSINNSENVISASTSDFASIVLLAGVAGTGSIAVKDQITTYPAGTFAGFNISNPSLINANLLSGLSVETYLNGVLQETSSVGTLVSVSSSLTGGGAQTVGFVSTLPFNEVKLKVSNLLGILNTTNVYNVVLQKFCAGPALTCTTNTPLINPAYPVIIDGTKSGIGGVACLACSVNNSQNVIDNNLSNSASIVLAAGLLANGSIAVKDQITTYPAGTFAGFDIDNVSLIGVNLLGGTTVRTYLNGVQQETSGGNLISLELLSASRQIVGFQTTLPFDEVRITVGNFASVDLGTTIVYNAVLRKASAGVIAPIITATTVTNTCPATTFSLAALANTGTKPAGTTLVWSTNKVPTSAGDTLTNLTAVATAGKYYALYFDAVNNCYSPEDSVEATITTCNIAPVATLTTSPSIINDGTSKPVADLTGTDADGTVDNYRITTLPLITQGVLYLADGSTPVTTAMILTPGQANGLLFIPTTGFAGDATFDYTAIDNLGLEDATPSTVTLPVTAPVVVTVSGNVFNDPNAGNVNNSSVAINTIPIGISAYLVKDGAVVSSSAVATNGTYSFANVPAGTGYTVVISTTPPSGSTPPAVTLPTGWNSTGEFNGTPNTNSDVTVNGTSESFDIISTNITNINFGIQQAPETAINVQPTQVNPGGTISVTVPDNAFQTGTGGNPNTDDPTTGGAVSRIDIPTFPTGATSITVGSTIYLATDPIWGSGGISIPYIDGVGLEAETVSVDPIDGTTDVVIQFEAVDNAGEKDPTAGSITLPFTAPANLTPVFTSGPTATTPENVSTTTPVYTATATDPNAGQTQTYSFETGGADNAKFAINPTTGAVTFIASPDFENPTDAGGDNVYNIKVKVCDNGIPVLCAIQDVAITVTNIVQCIAGTNAPIITATTVSNTCPTTTFSLAALANTGTKPAGTSLIWSTNKVPTSAGDTLTNLTTVSTAGKYYALYYDKLNNCYSPADSVEASLVICAINPLGQIATTNQPKTGTASTELTPTGGNGTYTFSVDNSGVCTPAVGATALPGTSNLTVTNSTTGAYTYTAPATAGTYYFCIKVCDTSSPTPSCLTKTYTLVVSSPVCAVGSAIPGLK